MPEISLTNFLDFLIASGTPRITCVRNAKEQSTTDYEPAADFWKPLREAIINLHKNGISKNSLDKVLKGLTDPKKRKLYPNRVDSYKRWMGNKQFKWSGCSTEVWGNGSLSVKVNPELGLWINGDKHVIKLYFKTEVPHKRRLDTILHLLHSTLPKKDKKSIPGVLDIPRGRLITPTVPIPNIDALLLGEAAAFVAMWDQV